MTKGDSDCTSLLTKRLFLTILVALTMGFTARAQEPYFRVVRGFEMPKLGIDNPAGLVYSPAANAFLVAPAYGSNELRMVSLAPDLTGSFTLTMPLAAQNMAFDGRARSLLFWNDDTDELVEIEADEDGLPKSIPDAIRRYNTTAFGIDTAAGITVDPETGHLFILVTPNQHAVPRIVKVAPDPQQRFDGPVVSTITLNALNNRKLRGIALNPANGHLYVLDITEQTLYELSKEGNILNQRDLSDLVLRSIQNMAFAPSGDLTDDPDIMNLYLVDSGEPAQSGQIRKSSRLRQLQSTAGAQNQGDVFELSLTEPKTLDLSTMAASGTHVQTIETSSWSPSSPDPTGLAYFPPSGNLLVTDSEVNEMAMYAGVNQWETTLNGNQVQESSTTAFTDEPTGIAYNPDNQHLFFSDDTGVRRIYELNPGSDGLYYTADDIVTSFKTGAFSSYDPEGIAYDNQQGHLFIADGVNAEVYEIDPGANGIFDGVPPAGDDIVSQFDTAILGLRDPEGVEFNPDTGTLFIVSQDDGIVVETARDGIPVSVFDVASTGAINLSGVAYGPSSANASENSLYLVARGVDNNSDPDENDGKLYEISLADDDPNAIAISFQDGLNGYSGTKDAVLKANSPATNFGNGAENELDGSPDESALLFWDVTAIPAGSTIESVTITFNTTNTARATYELYAVKRPWVESEATWNEFASGQRWETAGAGGAQDKGTTVLGAIVAPNTGETTISLNIDGIAVVQGWIDEPSSNHGLISQDYVNHSNGLDFSSREVIDPALRPKLTITYTGMPTAGNMAAPVDLAPQSLPDALSLAPNYPNPFNLETHIEYALPDEARVRLEIYNVLGQRVRVLTDAVQETGFKKVAWDGRDDSERAAASGIYFVRLTVDQQILIDTLTLQR